LEKPRSALRPASRQPICSISWSLCQRTADRGPPVEVADSYVYPGTGVLRNLAGLQDADVLADREAQASTR
jgi:hypothetical protein